MKLRYARYRGSMDEAERDRIRRHPLYQHGDTVLAWVNEGDLCEVGESMDPADPVGTYGGISVYEDIKLPPGGFEVRGHDGKVLVRYIQGVASVAVGPRR